MASMATTVIVSMITAVVITMPIAMVIMAAAMVIMVPMTIFLAATTINPTLDRRSGCISRLGRMERTYSKQ
jgi:ABC-type multidrug transport system permease subunit